MKAYMYCPDLGVDPARNPATSAQDSNPTCIPDSSPPACERCRDHSFYTLVAEVPVAGLATVARSRREHTAPLGPESADPPRSAYSIQQAIEGRLQREQRTLAGAA